MTRSDPEVTSFCRKSPVSGNSGPKTGIHCAFHRPDQPLAKREVRKKYLHISLTWQLFNPLTQCTLIIILLQANASLWHQSQLTSICKHAQQVVPSWARQPFAPNSRTNCVSTLQCTGLCKVSVTTSGSICAQKTHTFTHTHTTHRRLCTQQ